MPSIEEDFPSFNLTANTVIEELPFQDCNGLADMFTSDNFQIMPEVVVDQSENINVSDMPLSENFEEHEIDVKMEPIDEAFDQKDSTENDKNSDLPLPPPSLFNESTPRPWPWDETIKFNLGITSCSIRYFLSQSK